MTLPWAQSLKVARSSSSSSCGAAAEPLSLSAATSTEPTEAAPVGSRVLLDHGEQIDERCDRIAGRSKVGIADPIGTVLHEGVQCFVRKRLCSVAGLITAVKHAANVRQQDE